MFTVSNLDGIYNSIEEALQAWIDAGCPRQRGSSVWITEHDGIETVRTITIASA